MCIYKPIFILTKMKIKKTPRQTDKQKGKRNKNKNKKISRKKNNNPPKTNLTQARPKTQLLHFSAFSQFKRGKTGQVKTC